MEMEAFSANAQNNNYLTMENTSVSIAYNYIDKLVKTNEPVIEAIDGDPELKKQFVEDAKKMEQVEHLNDKITALMFDNYLFSARDDGDYKYLDIVNSRAIPYGFLRRAGATETPRLIKNLRRLQLTGYSQPAVRKKYGKEVGFALEWKDPNFKATDEENKQRQMWEIRLAEKFFFPAGEKIPSLLKFLGEAYENFFDFDDITTFTMRDMTHYPIGMRLEDPMLWKPIIPRVSKYPRHDQDLISGYTEEEKEEEQLEIENPEFDYLMWKDGRRVAAVTSDFVKKHHLFTRSDYQLWRRGYSIMEQAVNATAIVMNAITYNATNFTTDRTPMGVLALTGGFTNQLLIEKLKKVLWASMSGAANKRRLPIVGLPEHGDAKWVSMHANNKDMEFYTGLTFFISIICGLSGTNPNELGIASFQDAMKGNRLNEANNDGVWKQSQDNGLKTFVNHMEAVSNSPAKDGRNIFEEVTKLPVRGVFKGLADEDLKAKNEINSKRLTIDTSVNEIRKEQGLKPAEYKIGEINIYDLVAVENSQIASFISQNIQSQRQEEQQKQMMAQQQQATGEEGNPEDNFTDEDRKLIQQYGRPE
jgi:hypothetical protein